MTVTDKQGNPVAISDLNAEEVGAVLMMLVPSCLLAGHDFTSLYLTSPELHVHQ